MTRDCLMRLLRKEDRDSRKREAEQQLASLHGQITGLVEQWKAQQAGLEQRYTERLTEGTMYDTLSQHFTSSIVMIRNCTCGLADLLVLGVHKDDQKDQSRAESSPS